jgi:hypothetical protein
MSHKQNFDPAKIQSYTDRELVTFYRLDSAGIPIGEMIDKEFARRESLKPVYPSIMDQLAFIIANDPENEQYKIKEVFESCFDKALSKVAGSTFSHGRHYLLKNLTVDYHIPKQAGMTAIEVNVDNFKKYLSRLTIPESDFSIFMNHHLLFTSYYFRPGEKGNYEMKSEGYSSLCHLVQYLVDGIARDTYKETNDFLGSQKIGYSQQSEYQYTYGNITVKKFKNGRVDLKGITSDQQTTIDKLFAIKEKIKNII